MQKFTKIATLVATSLFITACSDNDNDTAEAETRVVSATFANLDVLGDDYVYEGWLITPSGAVSAGRFESSGASTSFDFDASAATTEVATTYVLTIEPAEDDEPTPAATHVLAGDISSDSATLSIGHAAALGHDFIGEAGVFGLAVPTDSAGAGAYQNGIWWLQQPGPAAGLSLPVLPEGWVYEGWVAGPAAGGPVSTGRFTTNEGADSDGAGSTGGADAAAAPPFPGQDFIVNPAPLNLIGLAAVISVEPEPDNSAAPFVIKPLIDANIEDVGSLPATQDMASVIGENQPTGSVVIN